MQYLQMPLHFLGSTSNIAISEMPEETSARLNDVDTHHRSDGGPVGVGVPTAHHGAADRGGGNVRAVAVTVARVAVVCTPRKVAPALPGPRCMKKPHDASVYVMPNLLFHCLCYTGILYHSNHTMQAPATLALS